jgi:hypothetical protein
MSETLQLGLAVMLVVSWLRGHLGTRIVCELTFGSGWLVTLVNLVCV